MPDAIDRIDANLDGIGHLISDKRIETPPYQRSFAWEKDQVTDLLRDIGDAIRANAPEYFLGTIVLTPGENQRLHIIDGQQRLASTTIFLAEIRNYFRQHDDNDRAGIIQSTYIAQQDRRTLEDQPNLLLNQSDNPFFQALVVSDDDCESVTEAHKRIRDAKSIAEEFVQTIVRPSHEPTNVLNDWLDYIESKVKVIVVIVSSEANAYTIFEVLNDRGIELSIADLLKNYLFRVSGPRLHEVQNSWTSMRSRIESVDREQAIKTFIRHAWSSTHGLTRERELYDKIRERVTGAQRAVDFAVSLDRSAADYVALYDFSNPRWRDLGARVQDAVFAFRELRVVQNRPLILAILREFDDPEIRLSFPMLISWTVRFLICGSGGSGTLEALFSNSAQRISSGEVVSARQLFESNEGVLPSDQRFEEAFATASVSKNFLARFYLRAIASFLMGDREFRIDQHYDNVNLEHILPQEPGDNWMHITEEDAANCYKKLGNLTVMDSNLNVAAANAPFEDKKVVYRQSRIEMTRSLGNFADWSRQTIEERQRELAQAAVQVWPVTENQP